MSRRMTRPARDEAQTSLTALAALLEYPGADFAARLARAAGPAPLARFEAGMSALSPDEREELYTATFDVAPACVAYVGIHLFGEENSKRGEFMAGLNARYEQAGFACPGELPDHLAVLLRYAADTDEAERRELVEFCLLGPLGKMIDALAGDNPYRALLEAVREVLQAAFPGVQPALSPLEQMKQHSGKCVADACDRGCGGGLDNTALRPGHSRPEGLSLA
jgi:nitrate reductase molybdenum cofactor assembly chaperone NarJ/NarW